MFQKQSQIALLKEGRPLQKLVLRIVYDNGSCDKNKQIFKF